MQKKPYEAPSLTTPAADQLPAQQERVTRKLSERVKRKAGPDCGMRAVGTASEQAQRRSDALGELAQAGSNMCVLLHAVSLGATLQLSGQGSAGGDYVWGSIELTRSLLQSAPAFCSAGCHYARAQTLPEVIAELAAKWKSAQVF